MMNQKGENSPAILSVPSNFEYKQDLKEVTAANLSKIRHNCTVFASTKAESRWCKLVSRYLSTVYARKGELKQLKLLIGKVPELIDYENLARAACRFRMQQVLEYVMDTFDIDPNKENSMGFPLMFFAVFAATGQTQTDHGQVLKLLVEKYHANVHHIHKDTGQRTSLFTACRNPDKNCLSILRYLVEVHKIDLLHRDKFGGTALHMAAMSNNTASAEYIIKQSGFHSLPSDWIGMWNSTTYTKIRTATMPEVENMVHIWRKKGFLKYCHKLSPMAVALVHNNQKLAARLYGIGCPEIPEAEAKERFQTLFDNDNWNFKVVCKTNSMTKCQTNRQIVLDILDQFVDVSRGERLGLRFVQFDLGLLYGSSTTSVHSTPLSILMDADFIEAFDHEAIKATVAVKWVAFGLFYCQVEFWSLVIMLTSFCLGFIFQLSNKDALYAMRAISAVMAIYFLHIEAREAWSNPSLKVYFFDFWNLMALSCNGLLLALFFLVGANDEGTVRNFEATKRLVVGPAALLLILFAGQHLKVAPRVSKFIVLIKIMMIEAAQWCVLLLLFLFAASTSFYAMLKGDFLSENISGFSTYWECLLQVIGIFTTLERPEFSEDPKLNALATILFIGFGTVVSIIYLNILIAMMTERFETVSEESKMRSVMELAEILCGYEMILPTKVREKYWQAVNSSPDEKQRKISLNLGLASEKVSAFISGGKVLVAMPSEKDFLVGDGHILHQLKSSIESLRKEVALQDEIISDLTQKGTQASVSTKRISVYGGGTKPRCIYQSMKNTGNLEIWESKFVELTRKRKQKTSAVIIQAWYRGWKTRKYVHSQFIFNF